MRARKASALGLLSVEPVPCKWEGDNLAQDQALMPLKCQRLQKGRETAKTRAHPYFSMADAIIH